MLPPGRPTVRTAGAAGVVVDAATPAGTAAAVSRALFDRSPLVVVADAGDPAGVDTAAAQSARLGVPLLLINGAGHSPVNPNSGSESTRVSAPSASPQALTANPELLGEITRLHARTVLAVGTGVADRLAGVPGVAVVSDPARFSGLPAAPVAPVAVLVPAGADTAALRAAAASAKAAGAHLIPVTGWDLRGDPAAITALAALRPDRVIAVGGRFGPLADLNDRVASATAGAQLPGGGQLLFPGHRLVALYGAPGIAGLGALGQQDLPASIARVKKIAAPYQRLSAVPVNPTFEIIATVADKSAGDDGNYSAETPSADLRQWVQAAAAAGVYVVLDLQPGRSDFLTQAKLYTDLLRLPGVGLTLDPEWRLDAHQVPLEQIGGVDAQEINSIITWLADLTEAEHLPQKLLVLHQFKLSMIRSEDTLDLTRQQVSVLIQMDGQGAPQLKDETWAAVTDAAPPRILFGWKNFYRNDTPTATPEQTMNKRPTPLLISYE